MSIPDDVIEQVRDTADIVSIVGDSVDLKRTGSDYRGACPFHGGTHRNLAVIPKKGMFYCYVCHEAGDVFSFFMKRFGMDYPTAVREVARKVGIVIPERSERQGPDPNEPLFSAASVAHDWFARQLRESAGRLYVADEADGPAVQIRRIDPNDGTVVASETATDVDSWAATPAGVVVLNSDRQHLDVFDPLTLRPTRRVLLPSDSRAALYPDVASSDPVWIGAYRRDTDQLAGRYTAMAAYQIDVTNGTVSDQRETPPCGPYAVTQVRRSLVATLSCSYQVVTIDLDDSTVAIGPGFPSPAVPSTFGDDVWVRWKSFGYLARIRDAGRPHALDGIETLDLNTEGPVLATLGRVSAHDRDMWIVGHPADRSEPVLYRIDPDKFVITARRRVPYDVVFVGDRAYSLRDGNLVTFDPEDVTGSAPRTTTRPSLGAPAADVADSPDEQAAVDAFTSVWDVGRTNEEIAPLLGGDLPLLAVRSKLVSLVNQLYPGVEARVTAVDARDGRASISYVFIREGQLMFTPFTATLTHVGDAWQVDRDSVCQLAAKAAVATC